jgi:dTDP-3-amino-2,3,6-trideoxy-4-keto-D-glucose/dTDP-3-amino-3,4,6-trideoxy-alpha-D-glucose/dTDP-2,6-dideoxy-D-kanosamine transaminase
MLINDLKVHTAEITQSVESALKRVLARGWYVLGPEVERFERNFADYLGVSACKSVANGTDALELALRASGLGTGDLVATAANAGMYATTAVLAAGAAPQFMDVALESSVITPPEVEEAIETGVKAVVVTHLYGLAVPDIARIAALCRDARVALIEDCAQAHGALVGDKRVGSFGDIGCFSFYPTKNLGALGDGGAVVANEASFTERVGRLRQYGWASKYTVSMAGARNSRLDEMQAAVLSELLPRLDGWNARRRHIANQYSSRIFNPDVIVPPARDSEYVAHLFVIRSAHRDSLRTYLETCDIGSDVHYPIPDHRQPVFGDRFANVILPNTERLANEVLTLPCYPEMSAEDVDRVIEAVNAWRP